MIISSNVEARSFQVKLIILLLLSISSSKLILSVQDNEIVTQDTRPMVTPGGFSCHLRELEICFVGAGSFMQNANGIPVTKQEVDRQCELYQESSECFMKYGEKCMLSRLNVMIGMIAGSMFDAGRELCDTNSQLHADYMTHAKCLKSVQKKHQNECVTQLQVAFEPIHKIAHEKRMPLACCNIKRAKACFGNPLTEECGEEAHHLVDKLIEKSLGTHLCLLCRNYDPASEQCQALLPPLDAQAHYGRNTSALSRIISSYTRIRIV